MSNLKKYIKKYKSSIGNGSWNSSNEHLSEMLLNLADAIDKDLKNNLANGETHCKYVKREGESCTLNNNCKYPNCDDNPVASIDKDLQKARTTDKEQPNYYLVYLCGCTDCFVHAAFFDENDAEKWAKDNSVNPEGYIIKKYNGQKLLNELSQVG